jgi:hypothetical protein
VGYVPSTDGDNITLDEISAAISEISFAQADESGPAKMRAVFSEVRDLLSTYSLKAVLNKAEAVEAPHEPAGDLPAEEQPESGEPQL